MAQLIIDTGTAANDGTGDPLRTAFTETNTNFTAIYTAGPVDSNVRITDNTILTLNTNGNLVLAPNGVGKVVANVDIVPNSANIKNLGSTGARWNTVLYTICRRQQQLNSRWHCERCPANPKQPLTPEHLVRFVGMLITYMCVLLTTPGNDLPLTGGY